MMYCEAHPGYLIGTCRFETVGPDATIGANGSGRLIVQMACMSRIIVLAGRKSLLQTCMMHT